MLLRCGILDIFGLPDTVVEEGGDVVLASAHLQVDRFIAARLVIHLLFAKTVFFKSSVKSNKNMPNFTQYRQILKNFSHLSKI
jgi:hypothetical protein